jgi:CDP-diglyceride synthetase
VNKTVLFFGAIAAAVVCAIVAVYYAIPGYHHVLTFSKSHAPNDMQPTHVALFAVLAIICVIAALVTRPKAKTSAPSRFQ